jgi:hypothetical protein
MGLRTRWGEDLGAGKRIPLHWPDRAGFEPCVRVASPRIASPNPVGWSMHGAAQNRRGTVLAVSHILGAPSSSPHRVLGPIRPFAHSPARRFAYSDSLGLISPEPDRVAFLVDSSKLASRGIDHQTKPFGFAFERVESEGPVLHVHFGARQNIAAYNRGHINEVTVSAIGCPYDSTDWRPFIASAQRRDGHCHH